MRRKKESKVESRTREKEFLSQSFLPYSLKGATLLIEVLVVVIVVISSIIVYNIANSFLEEGRSVQRYNLAREIMTSIDAVIRELATEAPGAMRTIRVEAIEGGELVVSGKSDAIIYSLLLPREIIQSGLRFQEGNLLIISGPYVNAYESDVDSDGTTDFVLENSAVLFAVKKLGSPGSHVSINTTSIITRMRNKQINVNVNTPLSLIAINDLMNSTFGTGHTEFTRSTTFAQSNSIRVVMNTTSANISYIAEFSLSGSSDFVELEIKQINRY